MSEFLQVITETSEASELTDRIQVNKSKTISFHTPGTTMSNIISSKIERDNIIALLKGKIKKIELSNTKILRNAENIKRKQDFLSEARKHYEDFQDNLECYKNESLMMLEIKKRKVQYITKALKENIVKSKEDDIRRKSEKRKLVLLERSENEDYIKRREAYYLKEAKEIKEKGKRRASSVAGKKEICIASNYSTDLSNKRVCL